MINPKHEDTIKTVRRITKIGSDLVIEAAGTTQTVEQTPYLVRKAGKVALVGESKGYLNLEDADEAMFFTIYISPTEYPSAVELISRKLVDVKGIITHRFKFTEFEKALETVDNPNEKTVKVIINQ